MHDENQGFTSKRGWCTQQQSPPIEPAVQHNPHHRHQGHKKDYQGPAPIPSQCLGLSTLRRLCLPLRGDLRDPKVAGADGSEVHFNSQGIPTALPTHPQADVLATSLRTDPRHRSQQRALPRQHQDHLHAGERPPHTAHLHRQVCAEAGT